MLYINMSAKVATPNESVISHPPPTPATRALNDLYFHYFSNYVRFCYYSLCCYVHGKLSAKLSILHYVIIKLIMNGSSGCCCV